MDGTPKSYEFQMPAISSPILHRQTLVQALINAIEQYSPAQSSYYKLILLCASAGYGKTTLLVDDASQVSRACCWYIFHETDANASLVLRRFYATRRCFFPAFGRQVTPLLGGDEAD